MTEYCSTLDLDAAADLLRQTAGPVVVLTHAKPDGDAFGAVIALTAALRHLGKSVTASFAPPVSTNLSEMPGADLAEVYDAARTSLPTLDASLYIVLDTGAWSQLGPVADLVRPHLDRTLIVDHHLSGDIEADYRLIDGAAAATCELVAALIERLLASHGGAGFDTGDDRLTRTICEGLFLGIASDTGWFRFSNTRPQTHELAARLLRHGVDHAALYSRTEQSERPQKLALLIRALDSLKLVAGGRAAIMSLNLADFEETGALEEETERLIDLPQQVGTIQVIVLASESRGDPGNGIAPVTRLSFRSKPGPEAVNVAELARRFDGGGHARAAGAKLHEPLAQVLPQLERALEEVLSAG